MEWEFTFVFVCVLSCWTITVVMWHPDVHRRVECFEEHYDAKNRTLTDPRLVFSAYGRNVDYTTATLISLLEYRLAPYALVFSFVLVCAALFSLVVGAVLFTVRAVWQLHTHSRVDEWDMVATEAKRK